MSATASPFGLMPVSDQFGFPPRTMDLQNGIASGLAANIFKGTPVKLVTASGTIAPCTATGDKIYGIFAGVEYTPTGQRPVVSDFWASGSTYVAGYERMDVYIWPAWGGSTRFRIQADGAVAQTLYGQQFNLSNFTAGSTVSGIAGVTVAAAGVGAGNQGQVQLVEFYEGVASAVGDAFTDLIVQISYPAAVSGFQVSPT
jgi:hypothetical protein